MHRRGCGELRPKGVVAVAVPVFDSSGRVVAALKGSSHSKKITRAELVRSASECCKRSVVRSRVSSAASRPLAERPELTPVRPKPPR